MKIEKVFKYNQDDLVRFGMNSYLYKRIVLLIITTSIFIIALAMLLIINGGLGQLEIFIALIYISVLAASPIVARTQMKKAYNSSDVLKEEQGFVISDENFFGKSSSGESKVEWSKFHEFVIYKYIIALYISTRQAFILPKRMFEQSEINELINFLTTDERTKKKVKISKYI